MNTLLTVKEVADLLRVHPSAVRRYLKRGELEGLRLGKNGPYRVKPESLDAFMQSQAEPEVEP